MSQNITAITTGSINVEGTSLQGYLEITYDQLVSIFGEPNSAGDEYKTDAEWDIKLTDGDFEVTATIYNWKNGKNYCGPDGCPTNEIVIWHVGGGNKKALYAVVGYLEQKLQTNANYIARMFGDAAASFLHVNQPVNEYISFVNFFDATNKEHVRALKFARTTGSWPTGFIPKNVISGGSSVNDATTIVVETFLNL